VAELLDDLLIVSTTLTHFFKKTVLVLTLEEIHGGVLFELKVVLPVDQGHFEVVAEVASDLEACERASHDDYSSLVLNLWFAARSAHLNLNLLSLIKTFGVHQPNEFVIYRR
jgi:hypothetical protein